MATFHKYYTDESLREHREYLKEIIKYLKKHPDEDINLYEFVNEFQHVLGDEDPIYKRVADFRDMDHFYDKFVEVHVKIRNYEELMSEKEFHDYFVEKFPQWKDIYYY